LQALVESVARLVGADEAIITRQKDGAFYRAESFGFSDEFLQFVRTVPVVPERGSAVGRALLEGVAVHISDVEGDPEYTFDSAQRLGDFRSLLAVPMLREGTPVGVILLTRKEPRAFTAKQIELATTFADQAAIAIENVRLFDEVQARTDELSQSLEQQTATSEVLRIISSSPGELKPVFDAMLKNAVRICEAKFGVLFRHHDGTFQGAAWVDVTPAYEESLRQRGAFRPDVSAPLYRLLQTKQLVHTADESPNQNSPAAVYGGARSLIAVPMNKEDELVGAFVIYRTEVRPFTDKQVELVTNFAAQAVIATENARLLNELRQRTNDLTKSLEDLRNAQDRLVQTEKLASLGQLTAGIAHEIKNPLNFVNNFSALSAELAGEMSDVLAGVTLDKKTRGELDELAQTLKSNLEKVVQHGRRADSIVKNMLQHSREGSGEHRPTDINAIVDESLNLAYHGARAEKAGFSIALQRDLDPSVGMADVYPQEITRVLLNLISNGFYAATKRRAEVGDGFEPMLSAATKNLGDKVEIRIRDNGTGIPEDVKDKIFNPFFTTKPSGEGTGLGLSMSHDIIVKQHGGSIDVETEPGLFTEFKIVLPRTSQK
jgi:signal transduction histidine kinase